MATDKNMTALHETLDGLELDDLRQVQKKVEKLIAGYQDRKRREAISAAEGVLKEHGFKLATACPRRAARRLPAKGRCRRSMPTPKTRSRPGAGVAAARPGCAKLWMRGAA